MNTVITVPTTNDQSLSFQALRNGDVEVVLLSPTGLRLVEDGPKPDSILLPKEFKVVTIRKSEAREIVNFFSQLL